MTDEPEEKLTLDERFIDLKLKKPKTLAAAADAFYAAREERYAADKVAAALRKTETLLSDYLIATLPVSEATGVAGKLARVEIVKKEIPQVNDWTKFYAFLLKKKAVDLLQRRLAEGAIQERWGQNIEVPGVVKFTKKVLSVSKLKQGSK